MLDGTGLDPIGPRDGRALLKEEISGSAVGISFHDHGAINQMGEQIRRDLSVVSKQVSLGNTEFRPEELLQVG